MFSQSPETIVSLALKALDTDVQYVGASYFGDRETIEAPL
jgi:hypothetical protein